ncbi:MAG: DUF4149 domain-containing protein [Pseudomonadota bacterium]
MTTQQVPCLLPDRVQFLAALERILLTAWVGTLWATGFMVAPVLFAVLDDRALAGSLAGRLFGLTAWGGLVCGLALLASAHLRSRRTGWRTWVLVAMLLLTAVGQFVLTPMIAELRTAGLAGTPRFGQLHGIASVLFVLTALLGLGLVAAGPAVSAQSAASR